MYAKMKVIILLVMICANLAKQVQCNSYNDDFPEKIYMNTSVNPCDDFYEYTCGNFKNVYPLDEGSLTVDHFTLLEDRIVKIANEILSENEFMDDPQALNKSKSVYQSCVDTVYLNKVKNPEMNIVNAEHGFPLVQLPSVTKNIKYGFNDIGDAVSRYGIPMLFNLATYTNIEESSQNLLYIYSFDATNLGPTEIGNIRPTPIESYDEFIEKGFVEWGQTNKYKRHLGSPILQPFDIFLRKMALKLRNATQSILTDEQVFNNIDKIAAFTRGLYRNGENVIKDFTNTTITLKELNIWTKEQFNDTVQLDWVQFLQHYFSNSAREITEETKVLTYTSFAQFVYGIINLVRNTEDHVVKSYVLMRIFTLLSPDGDGESRQYIDEYFTGKNFSILPRWKYCTRKIIDSVGTAGLSFALAYEYQLRHFNVNHFTQALELIEDIQAAYKEIIENTNWMDATTKTKAMKKFDNMITILAHPDISYNKEDLDKFYENLRICKWDNYGNSLRIRAFKNAYQISQISKRERAFWERSPFEVNAYYNRPNNKIIFPMSMLNPVFFGNKNRILDYGRIGAIVGHEMTHGFDKDGMAYGPDGTIESWWTKETKEAFVNRTTCFVNEYDNFYEPEINAHVNGTITLNENIADNGGVRESYRAMKKMIGKHNIVKGTSEFTPDQLFFIGFGTLWCSNPSIAYLKKANLENHARLKFRVNGVVSNMEEFSKAFNCPVESNMNPKNKCILW